jgi:hypothetical protein
VKRKLAKADPMLAQLVAVTIFFLPFSRSVAEGNYVAIPSLYVYFEGLVVRMMS